MSGRGADGIGLHDSVQLALGGQVSYRVDPSFPVSLWIGEVLDLRIGGDHEYDLLSTLLCQSLLIVGCLLALWHRQLRGTVTIITLATVFVVLVAVMVCFTRSASVLATTGTRRR